MKTSRAVAFVGMSIIGYLGLSCVGVGVAWGQDYGYGLMDGGCRQPGVGKPDGDCGGATLGGIAPRFLSIRGPLDPIEVRRAVIGSFPFLEGCYGIQLLTDPWLSGVATIRMVIGGQGSVMGVVVTMDTLSSPVVARCMGSVLRRIVMPAAEGRGVTVVDTWYSFKPNPGALQRFARATASAGISNVNELRDFINYQDHVNCTPGWQAEDSDTRHERMRLCSVMRSCYLIYAGTLLRDLWFFPRYGR